MATQPTRKTPARRGAARSSEPKAPAAGGELLKAGLKAVTGHNPLFEALLGLDAAHKRQAKELFRLRTFEDLFDERVARTLARLGTTRSLDELRAQLAALDKRLAQVERLLQARSRGQR